MKNAILLTMIFLISGCALTPKPLVLSTPPTHTSPKSVSKLPYIKIIYPENVRKKSITTRSWLIGVANTLNVRLGVNIRDLIYRQAKLYYNQVDIISTKQVDGYRVPQIEVLSLYGDISQEDLSISGEMDLMIESETRQSERKTISFRGRGSVGRSWLLGPVGASGTLTKAEHEAMQQILDQLTDVLRQMHKESINVAIAKDSRLQSEVSAMKDIEMFDNDTTSKNFQSLKPILTKSELGRYHALVIGNSKYKSLPDLMSAESDAQEVAQLLRTEYGFTVKTIYNATRADILQSLSEYRIRLTKDDNLLIYYAGHGWLDREADEGYWLPVDATRRNPVNWVSNASITTALRAMLCKHIMIVADSCYSGKLTRGLSVQSRTPSFLSRVYRKKARVVLSSGGLEPVLDSGGNANHSVFASAFIAALRENSNFLDGTTLFTYIRRHIAWNADQIPEYGFIHKAGHDGGDFIFLKRSTMNNR